MLNEKQLLYLPGPTPVPAQVAAAMTQPMINHRGDAFAVLYGEIAEGLQKIFQTREQVYVLPGAGSGGFEAALVNFLNPGDRILACVIGDFGERWAKAAAALGFQVDRLDFAPGLPVDPAALRDRLAADQEKAYKAVLFQHNETSTGVTNPVAELAAEVHRHGALVMVDSVSGLGALPLEMDAWGLDVVLTGAQKALMCPPGLTILAASQKAWAASEQARCPRFFFDLRPYRASYDKRQTPYTPPVSLLFGLREALRMIHKEGLANAFARHRLMGAMCRAGARAMGLDLLCQNDQFASNSVTAVKVPAGVEAKAWRGAALKTFGVILAPGQGRLQDTIIRIGHLGYVTPNDVLSALLGTELALAHVGAPVELGQAAAAAQSVWLGALQGKEQ